ncbi:hypothetical protein Leryth_008078 [Lithospermum erythrorhizon]|nr:hypothetical protein Leryth_008078 [Lithospermum erythrorhizon]
MDIPVISIATQDKSNKSSTAIMDVSSNLDTNTLRENRLLAPKILDSPDSNSTSSPSIQYPIHQCSAHPG